VTVTDTQIPEWVLYEIRFRKRVEWAIRVCIGLVAFVFGAIYGGRAQW